MNWAAESGIDEAKNAFYNGAAINETEKRAVLHQALRQPDDYDFILNGQPIAIEVKRVWDRMEKFCRALHTGTHTGYTGKRITDVVNIGIGGSDLGPVMVCEALKPYQNCGIKPHFVSNIDAWHICDTLQNLHPDTTLFIIASKTFTTQETLTNALTARAWFLEKGGAETDITKHFVAVSTNASAVADFGINPDNMFEFWDWVGGRFSLWSAIGLSIACAVGFQQFKSLLEGAAAMDKHFFETEADQNIPLVLAMISCWYIQFYDIKAEAILPYDQRLHRFTAYLQQGIMESNGKYVDRNGHPVEYPTSTVIFGEPGTNSQHSFFQLLHQGTHIIPAEFILCREPHHPYTLQHELLISNCLAQSEALMRGKTKSEALADLKLQGKSPEEIEALLPYKVFPGNKPSTTILLDKLTPYALGQLIALYEHKIFVQGIIWNIYSFDQWGVELGKALARDIHGELTAGIVGNHDSSTTGLLREIIG